VTSDVNKLFSREGTAANAARNKGRSSKEFQSRYWKKEIIAISVRSLRAILANNYVRYVAINSVAERPGVDYIQMGLW